jgi:UDP-3-O-[3-hydroxymyristoyl] glucosamine N-acyltransferase
MISEMSITDLASALNGQIKGNISTGLKIKGTCSIDDYVAEKVTFVKNQKYAQKLKSLKGAIILIPPEFSYLPEQYPDNIFVAVEDVSKAMIEAQHIFFGGEPSQCGMADSQHSSLETGLKICNGAYIYGNVFLGKGVLLSPRARIMTDSVLFENVVIGEGTIIEPHVTIYAGSQIGSNCIVRSGARIGGDGFRFDQDVENRDIHKMIHVGRVTIGDRVEIGCNSTICRSTFEDHPTVISDDVKIANQVDIAHNVRIGARTAIAPQTCICGSATIGDDVWVGVGVSVSNGVVVGNRAKLLLNAVVVHDVTEGEIVSGFYAMPHREWKRVNQYFKKLATANSSRK